MPPPRTRGHGRTLRRHPRRRPVAQTDGIAVWRWAMSRIVVLLAAVIATWDSRADAVVLCAKPRADGTFSTSVKIREACRTSETRLDPGALGLQGPPGATGPVGPTGAMGP